MLGPDHMLPASQLLAPKEQCRTAATCKLCLLDAPWAPNGLHFQATYNQAHPIDEAGPTPPPAPLQVPAEVKDKLQSKVDELKESINSEDVAKIKAAMEAVQQEAMALGQAVYGQQQAGGAAPGGGEQQQAGGAAGGSSSGPTANGDVIDAEFEDKK